MMKQEKEVQKVPLEPAFSTYTVHISDEYGQEIVALNTKLTLDMVSDGGDGLSGIEIERNLLKLATALSIPESQALEIIEHIEFGINDGQCNKNDFETSPDQQSMYEESLSGVNHYQWGLIQNKESADLSADEKEISHRLAIPEKEDYLYDILSKNISLKI